MTIREVVRTGLLLGGIWIVVSGVESVASSASEFVRISAEIGATSDVLLWSIGFPAVSLILFFLVFSLAPGLYVIDRSRRWADALVESDRTTELAPSLVLAVGQMILGTIWVVDGTISLLLSPISFYSVSMRPDDPTVLANAISALCYSVLWLGAGILVFRRGSRAVLHAA